MKFENGKLVIERQDFPQTVDRALMLGYLAWPGAGYDQGHYRANETARQARAELKQGFKLFGEAMRKPKGEAELDLTTEQLELALESYRRLNQEAFASGPAMEIYKIDALLVAIKALRS